MFAGNGGSVVTSPTGEQLHTEGNGFNKLIDLFNLKPNKISNGNAYLFEDVYACINVLSDDVAKLPLKEYRKDNGSVTRMSGTNIDNILSKQPNDSMTPFVFKKLMMVDVLTGGNFYCLIAFDKQGDVKNLIPLDAAVTRPAKTKTGEPVFLTERNGKTLTLWNHEVIHIKGYTTDGIIGRSPISVIADSAESNKTATEYNKEVLRTGGTPKGILSISGTLQRESKNRVRQEWQETNGNDAIAIIDSGMEYKPISMSQRDMEFIETQKYNQQKIAAIYKVPLHKINNLDHATFSNIEHQSLDYVKNTLQPWIVQIEEELDRKLYSYNKQTRGYYVKFNLDSELRGDAESRAKVQEINVRNGFNTVNEVRGQNEYSPYNLTIADEPLTTLNYTALRRLIEYQYKDTDIPVPDDNPDSETHDSVNPNEETQEDGNEADLKGGEIKE